jgi:glycine C-acetyltransferase
MVKGALKRLDMLKNEPEHREKLWKIVRKLQKGLKENGFNLGDTESPVTPVFIEGDIAEATNIVIDLRETYGIFCSMVIYPVVPKGTIMLRIIPTAAHSEEDVDYTIKCFKEMMVKLSAGKYKSDNIASMFQQLNK